ncbi:MAG: HD domain-containing protein [Treponema sp.]|jgi:poly(A) polymerase|nr:HD domain-containing protein [Treponema sp.]
MSDVPDTLVSKGFSAYLWGFSAIDAYLGRNIPAKAYILTNADISDLARCFEDLRFPGVDLADAALDRGERTWYFRCFSSEEAPPEAGIFFPAASGQPASFGILEWRQDWKSGRFYDPGGVYPLLRSLRDGSSRKNGGGDKAGPSRRAEPQVPWWKGLNPGADPCRALMDAALLLSCYSPGEAGAGGQSGNGGGGEAGGIGQIFQIEEMAALFRHFSGSPAPLAEEQRILLAGLLTSPRPDLGLELLKSGGFLEEFWPELAVLDDVDHSKEFHPEGNVWKHTLETFRYRKTGGGGYDLRLSLGLLLHDVGKPLAESVRNRRFDRHAELGERQARRFLGRLGFDAALTGDVCYLVRNHMLPAALPRLPLARTGGIMASPLFPVLLELYRCDESSSFKGPDGYYQSSAAYQSYLRYRRNPYRSEDGKKLDRAHIAGMIPGGNKR